MGVPTHLQSDISAIHGRTRVEGSTLQAPAALMDLAAEAAGLDPPDPRAGRHVAASHGFRPDRISRFAAARQAVEAFAGHMAG